MPETAELLHVEPVTLPGHVAIIMDGNGRWAQALGKQRVFGHRRGARAVRRIVRHSRKRGIANLTLFAMSTENLSRPKHEVQALFSLFRRYLQQEAEEMRERDIRLRVMGDREALPPGIESLAREVEEYTAGCRAMELTIAVAYGGHEDLLVGMRRLSERGLDITLENLEQQLWSSHLPPVDLLVRTGGERRISNFLLWHLAYAELHFTDVRWPDFSETHFERALEDYSRRQRRFGQVKS